MADVKYHTQKADTVSGALANHSGFCQGLQKEFTPAFLGVDTFDLTQAATTVVRDMDFSGYKHLEFIVRISNVTGSPTVGTFNIKIDKISHHDGANLFAQFDLWTTDRPTTANDTFSFAIGKATDSSQLPVATAPQGAGTPTVATASWNTMGLCKVTFDHVVASDATTADADFYILASA